MAPPAPHEVDPPSTVLPGLLWIGGSPIDWRFVHRAGVRAVVDVADPGPTPTPDDLRGPSGRITYVKQALVDHGELPPEDELDRLVDTVCASVGANVPTYVVCTFGKNRSGLVVALSLRRHLGCSGADALAQLRAVRTNAVNNRTFDRHVSGLPAPEVALSDRR